MKSIRIRINKQEHMSCVNCLSPRNKSLELYDIQIGELIQTICDECMSVLNHKSLIAVCNLNGKVKNPRDMKIINSRKIKKDKDGKF